VRSSVAFSTLGWFDDPLLTNLLRLEPERLVDVVLHELLHSTIYLSGQTAFNESFASFVGARGAIDFFTRRGEDERARHAGDLWEDSLTFSRILGEALAEIEAAYTSGVTAEEREGLFAAVRARFESARWRTSSHSDMSEATLNNAVLVHLRLYYDRLSLFDDALRANGENLKDTITKIADTARDAADPFGVLVSTPAQTSISSSRRMP
jgi:predicted aminopeptidase